jgi:hypothetical protein
MSHLSEKKAGRERKINEKSMAVGILPVLADEWSSTVVWKSQRRLFTYPAL